MVSVIIVSYQTRELTLAGLAGLRATGTAVPHEIILVDNASTDGSAAAVATACPEVRVYRLAANVGFARAVNAGAELARGQWLLLMNPDTEPVGDVLAAFVQFALANAGHGIYVGRTLHPDGSDDGRSCFAPPTLWSLLCFATGLSTVFRRTRWFNPEALPGVDRDTPALVPAGSGCLLLVERGLFRALGGFTPDYFMYGEDADLCARAAEYRARPVLVPHAQVTHRNGASSTTANKAVMLFRGKATYLRLRWSRRRAAVGRALLAAGVAVRAAGARLTGRAAFWRVAWAQRATWLAGWPPAGPMPALEPVRPAARPRPGTVPATPDPPGQTSRLRAASGPGTGTSA